MFDTLRRLVKSRASDYRCAEVGGDDAARLAAEYTDRDAHAADAHAVALNLRALADRGAAHDATHATEYAAHAEATARHTGACAEVHPDRLMCQADTRDDCDDDTHWLTAGETGAAVAPMADRDDRAKPTPEWVARVRTDLLETDALTPNDGETLHPDHYVVDAEDVDYLIVTIRDLLAGATS